MVFISNLRIIFQRNYKWIFKRKLKCEMSTNIHGFNHLQKTASNSRQKIVSEAVVKEIANLSKTVKLLKLELRDDNFSFQSGQWVDTFIPGVAVVGGFSICSPPHLLQTSRMLHLAVKYSDHPPAQWIHKQCQVGDRLNLKVGGDFTYEPSPGGDDGCDLILIAGGVGINPLFSMLQHFLHIHTQTVHKDGNKKLDSEVVLLYSAQNRDELIFRNEILKLKEKSENVTIRFFSTREPVTEDQFIINGRIQDQDIMSLTTDKKNRESKVYICGPLAFIETMEIYCQHAGFSKKCINIEKWW